MADWFKFYENDIDETRLQYAISKLPEVLPVWVGILSEACRHKTDTIRWGDNEIELFGFSRRLNVSIPKVNEAVNMLVTIDYISRGENTLKIIKWHAKQSEYCQKQDKIKSKKMPTVPTQSRHSPDTVGLEERRLEEKRGDEKNTNAGKPAVVSLGKASEIQVSKKPEAANTPVPTIHLPKGFEEFWKAYPNKKGKQAAARSYGYAIKKTTIEIMLSAIEKQKRGADWLKEGGQYIPHPTTWLNQGRWDDEVTPRHFKNVDSNLMQETIEVRSL